MSSKKALPETLIEAIRYFSDLDVCTDFVAKLRWPAGPVCPRCEGREHSYISTRRLWKCKGCKKQFSVKLGTIFEDSPLGLDKWLPAVWLVANSKNGISSHELARSLERVGEVDTPARRALFVAVHLLPLATGAVLLGLALDRPRPAGIMAVAAGLVGCVTAVVGWRAGVRTPVLSVAFSAGLAASSSGWMMATSREPGRDT